MQPADAPLPTPPGSPRKRGRRGVFLRVALFAALLIGAFAALRFTPLAEHLEPDRVLATFDSLAAQWWAPLLLIGLFVVLSSIAAPVSPLMLAGGIVFGFALGSAYNLLGLTLGALASYFLALTLGRDFVVHITGGGLRRAEAIFERHGFWPLVQTRFMPIPFGVVNFSAALAGVRPARFVAATLVGLVPSTLLHTYFIAALFEARHSATVAATVLAQYVAALVVFNVALGLPSIRAWFRQRADRHARSAGP